MELFAPFVIAGVFATTGFVLLQGWLSCRKYGIPLVVLGEFAIGLALIWVVFKWAEGIAADPGTAGPVGLVAGIWAAATFWSILAALFLNTISGFVIWRLTRKG